MIKLLDSLNKNYYIEFEEVLPNHIFKEKYYELITGKWIYFGNSNESSPYYFWNQNLIDDSFYNDELLKKIEKLCQQEFKLTRVFANGQTFGQPGILHQDSKDDDTYTFIIYMNPYWNIHWGGNTVFYKNENNYMSYTPKPNFGLIFKSNLLHVGLDPSRDCKELRITVAYTLQIK